MKTDFTVSEKNCLVELAWQEKGGNEVKRVGRREMGPEPKK